jgi:hypothetical protein
VPDIIDEPEEMYVFSVIPRDATDWGYFRWPRVLELAEDMEMLDWLDKSLGAR